MGIEKHRPSPGLSEKSRPGPLGDAEKSFSELMLSMLNRDQVVPARNYPPANSAAAPPLGYVPSPEAPQDARLQALTYQATAGSGLVGGMVDAWAAVGDVLSFYQRKLARIGYLRTAPDRASLMHLAHAAGLAVSPAISAQTVIAFEVQQRPGDTAMVSIASGLAILGVAADASEAVQFETIANVVADPNWNSVPLFEDTATAVQLISSETKQLFLRTVLRGIVPGDIVLVTERAARNRKGAYAGVVRSQVADPAIRGCVVTLAGPLAWSGAGTSLLQDPVVLRFTATSALWGSDAPDWSTLSDTEKAAQAPIQNGVAYWQADGAKWVRPACGLPATGVHALATDQRTGTLWAATDAGLYMLASGARQFSGPGSGIPRSVFHTLLMQDGVLYAGGSRGMVVRSPDGGRTWRWLQGSQPNAKAPDTRLPNTEVRCLLAGAEGLLAGTDAGVFLWVEGSTGWQEWSGGLPGYQKESRQAQATVYALAGDLPGARFFAATDLGVFSRGFGDSAWIASQDGLPPAVAQPGPVPASPLGAAASSMVGISGSRGPDYLFAVVAGQVFRRKLTTESRWVMVSTPSGQGVKLFCAAGLPSVVFTGTDDGVFRSDDLGASWQQLGARGESAAALLWSGVNSTVWKGGSYTGSSALDWSGMELARNSLEITGTLSQTSPGDYVVLSQDDTGPLLLTCLDVQVEARAQFGRRRQVHGLRVEEEARLPEFSRRKATLSFGSTVLELLPMPRPQPCSIEGAKLRLDSATRMHDLGRKLVLSGSPVSAVRMISQAGTGPLIGLELIPALDLQLVTTLLSCELGKAGIPINPSTRIFVASPGLAWCAWNPAGKAYILTAGTDWIKVEEAELYEVQSRKIEKDGTENWQLRSGDGLAHTVVAAPGQIIPVPAGPDAPTFAAEYTLSDVDKEGGILLDRPLDHLLDASSIRIQGNIADARHAMTIDDEILGSGSSTIAFQKFLLQARMPLTQTPANLGTQVLGDFLQVRVTGGGLGIPANGIKTQAIREADSVFWTQVSTLLHSKPTDRHFVLRVNSQGRTTVMFGDGQYGSRLPTGINNVRADYRVGAGAVGNLAAGNIKSSKRLPGVILRCSNPIAAHGGVDAKNAGGVRQQIGESSLRTQSIVVAGDVERFARSFAGVGSAHASTVVLRHRRVMVLSVLPEPKIAVEDLLPSLISALLAAGAPLNLRALAAGRLLFKVAAHIAIGSNLEWDVVAGALEQALQSRFGLKAARYGQVIHASEVIATLQSVEGVTACRLVAFHRSDHAGTVESALTAKDASPHDSGTTVRAAELLELTPGAVFSPFPPEEVL